MHLYIVLFQMNEKRTTKERVTPYLINKNMRIYEYLIKVINLHVQINR